MIDATRDLTDPNAPHETWVDGNGRGCGDGYITIGNGDSLMNDGNGRGIDYWDSDTSVMPPEVFGDVSGGSYRHPPPEVFK